MPTEQATNSTPNLASPELERRVTDLELQLADLRSGLATAIPGFNPSSNGHAPDPVQSAPQSEGEKPSEGVGPIIDWFDRRGAAVRVDEETAADRVFDRLSEYLGDHAADLYKLAGSIRWTILEGKSTAVSLNKMTPEARQHVVEFAHMLDDRAFLTYCHINEDAGRLALQAKDDQRLMQFISGHWLERYVLVKGQKSLEAASVDFSSARNLIVEGGKSVGKFEMDVLFLLGDEPIWVECKMRDFRRDIDKYAERAEYLDIPLDRTIVVVQSFDTEQAEEAAADIPHLYGLSVTDTRGLARHFEEFVAAAEDEGTEQLLAEADQATLVSRLSAYLPEAQLSPFPEGRRTLLEALVEATKEGLPATSGELRERAKASVPKALSPGVHPVLVAVRRGGGLLDENGIPSRGLALSTSVTGLVSDDVDALEAMCRGTYEEAIKRKMPEVAARADFAEIFEQVVGSGKP